MLISTFIVFTLGLGGIFLLLGYSSTGEALLRPHTNLGVQDAVRALQQYISHYVIDLPDFDRTLVQRLYEINQ
jgi:hypothetical protein